MAGPAKPGSVRYMGSLYTLSSFISLVKIYSGNLGHGGILYLCPIMRTSNAESMPHNNEATEQYGKYLEDRAVALGIVWEDEPDPAETDPRRNRRNTGTRTTREYKEYKENTKGLPVHKSDYLGTSLQSWHIQAFNRWQIFAIFWDRETFLPCRRSPKKNTLCWLLFTDRIFARELLPPRHGVRHTTRLQNTLYT